MVSILLAAFKAQYHRARSVAARLIESNAFGFELKADGTATTAQITNFHEGDAIRLAVLMYPFLHHDHKLYYENLWSTIQQECTGALPPDAAEAVHNAIEGLRSHPISVVLSSTLGIQAA
jgi:hypothetical protein